MFNTFKVTVKCIANGYTRIYDDCVSITQGILRDDLEMDIIGMRLTFKDGTTATFRDGFKIEIEVCVNYVYYQILEYPEGY